ncbi:MAG TPA: adenylate/guanylate cyclase domain-containing protein [Rhabdochlamydiaceae bacterium]|jgi:adenylate cyclase
MKEASKNPLARVTGHPFRRTLRVDILTLYLTLFIISFTFVITFTYFKEKRAIEEFSLGTIQRASDAIIERMKELMDDATRFQTITDSFVWDQANISINNEDLCTFLLRVVKLQRNFSRIFAASTDGNFLSANNLQQSKQRTYMTNTSKPLPEQARFSLLYVDNEHKPSKSSWYYVDENLEPICHEEQINANFDPRSRPWYIEAMRTGQSYWSDFFFYYTTGDYGANVSQPLYSKNGSMIGATGIGISSQLLSSLLTKYQVGKNGEIFLLNEKEEALFESQIRHHKISFETLSAALKAHSETKQSQFYFEDQGIKYLAQISSLALSPNKKWLIAIVVPFSDFFGELEQKEEVVLLISIGVLILSGILVFYFSKRISAPIVTLAKEIDRMKHLDLSSTVRIQSNITEIFLMDASIAALRNGLRSFARYVPRTIVEQLLEKEEEIKLGGEKKEITVFFSDIAGFTTLSESHSVEEAMAFLSEYFDALSKIIIKEEGIIDKYIGDSIMAFWGAPLEIKEPAVHACVAAVRCQRFLDTFNATRKEKGIPELPTRIAINSGKVIVGNIGTSERMNYTVIGDVVNTAAHLQQVNKIYHTQTIITEETFIHVKDRFLVRPLDIFAPAGKVTKIKIYELLAIIDGDAQTRPLPGQVELCELFTQGFNAFHEGSLQEAKSLFERIQKQFPSDYPTQLYIQRLLK